MSEFTKDKELDTTLSSGVTAADRRSGSTHFDQRRTLDASGVVIDEAGSRLYVADGAFNLSDYYPLTFNATGILAVTVREQRGCGNVTILDAAGTTVIDAAPSKYSSRANSTSTTTINASGQHYCYIEVFGRSGTTYKVGVDLYSS